MTTTPEAREVIVPGSDAYLFDRVLVITSPGEVNARTVNHFAKEHRDVGYGFGEPACELYYVDQAGALHRAKVEMLPSAGYDEDDYAVVRGTILDAADGTLVARFSYTVDGRV